MKDIHEMSQSELLAHSQALELQVTHSKRAVVDLLDTEERIRAILQTAVEGIITIDARGIIETINPAGERIFGYRSEELIGRNVSVLMPSPYREQHDGYIANYHRTGQAKIIGLGREVAGRRKDGSVFPMDLSVGEVRLSGGGRIYTGIVRDITERKRLEREILEISEGERQRIGQDLHDDLGQRLTAIEFLSQALEQDLAARDLPESGQAAKIALRVREAVAQTRSLARGLAPVELQPEGLHNALQELGLRLEESARVKCSVTVSEPLCITEPSIATQLYRIAQEATANALKHGRAKRIEITVAEEDHAIVLSVSDDGTGLQPGFEDAAGMGLRIMKYRAGMIGATLDLTGNGERTGTTVTCIVPASL